ncbi:hypothetical protein [Cellulomonas humilata]|uniref:Integral membrane protein n=1 Tax=Cellulomonas humilata TaxID=144055 RepID=A0ABU0EEX2_9CELL|nr:hypothetical protein [Cellulomonas humilata]MDQ0373585.1 hypothetical protein [Cellulomonas humilata]
MSGGHFVVENKPSPRKPRGTGAKPPAGAPDPSVGTPATDDAAATPDTESPYVTPDEEIPDDTGPSDAVASPEDENDTAEIPTGSPHDTAEIPTSIDVQVPASSPAEDRAVLLARLQLLETENARLRATATVPPPAPVAPRPRRKVGRSTAAVVLILIGALLAPIAVVGSWARGLVVSTDNYVDTVAPIAEDPLVQSAVANRITIAVVDALNVEELTTQATDAVAGLDLPPLVGQAVTSLQAPLQEAITGFIRKNVTKIVSSDAFENVWEEANRAAHEQIVATLRGDPDALAQISDTGTLTLDVTPIIEQVKTSLEEAGFTLVSRIPTINVTFPIASSADLVRLQSAYRLIDIVGGLLPYLSLALLAAGVLAAQHRSRALVVAGLSLAGAMLLLGIALALGRSLYASSLPPTVQRVDTAVAIYDQFVSLLRIELRVGLVLGLLLAIIAFAAGGTTAARQLRASSSHASAWLRSAGDRRGISTGPVGVWLDEQRTLVRVVIIALAALALVLADRLTPAYVVGVFVIALLVLGLVTLLARPRGAVPVEEEEPVLV